MEQFWQSCKRDDQELVSSYLVFQFHSEAPRKDHEAIWGEHATFVLTQLPLRDLRSLNLSQI